MGTSDASASSVMAAHIRGLLSFRRHQVVSMDENNGDHQLFLSNLADRLTALNNHNDIDFSFLSKLLDCLLSTIEEFRPIIRRDSSRPPLVADLLERTVKSLDICNALTLSLHSLHQWNRHAALAAAAVLPPNNPSGDGPVNRCRRALHKILDSPHCNAATSSSASGSSSSSRALPWIFSRILSGSSSGHLASPGAGEGSSAASLGVVVYSMSSMLVFCMWAMVVAVRCGGGALSLAAAVPAKQMAWAGAMVGLQERMRGVGEVAEVEGRARGLMEALRGRAGEAAERAEGVEEACGRVEEGLGALEGKVRQVFHALVECRAEVLTCIYQC